MLIHHCGLSALNVERLLEFYTETMGLKLVETVNLGGVNYYFVGDGQMMLEIEPDHSQSQETSGRGFNHLALSVEDLDGFSAFLREKQVKFVLEPVQLRPDRKIAFIEDPEGNRIQLIQFL